MKLTGGRRALLWLGGAGATCLVLVSVATAENPVRYPYDPACAWGRLSDGHGMLIRCLEPSEASVLLQSVAHPPSGEAGSSEAGRSEAESSGSKQQASESTKSKQRIAVSNVGPAQADTGELPLAAKKLGVPKDRYVECIRKNGGLTADTARVVVRFLVRERGRAEGVTVKSKQGMSTEAAACIADVVDRRYVGYPAAPIVGATLPIELSVQR